MNKTQPCDICKEKIVDIEILTITSGWFFVDEEIRFCPFCGRELNEQNNRQRETTQDS